eukprot:CAMPEP_0169169796 /NCGR_PEP_ID=MMETSP1015-20121227/61759_1 /TAXON_ID=342587 /ORGANISM="Karlodinium micrum, Strain CCMP2283" /LENGTH=67 /DNA_ID=CAMNT_0009242723 /DNA_START=761 /DNA_END=964 /DNA_ORIENTATION=-
MSLASIPALQAVCFLTKGSNRTAMERPPMLGPVSLSSRLASSYALSSRHQKSEDAFPLRSAAALQVH